MAYFSGSDWCPHCHDLNAEIFQDVNFLRWFNQRHMVPLLVDFPTNTPQPDAIRIQNAQLYTQYNIQGFPTVVAIRASGGYCTSDGTCVVYANEVGRVVGYSSGTGVNAWIASFSSVANIQ
jgi:hypothetical protein